MKPKTLKQLRLEREKKARIAARTKARTEEWLELQALIRAKEKRRPSAQEEAIRADIEKKAVAERTRATAGWTDTTTTGEGWRDLGR